MAVVTGQFMENGGKIVELAGQSLMMDEVFERAAKISNVKKADQFRLTVNGWSHTFPPGSTREDLQDAYRKFLENDN